MNEEKKDLEQDVRASKEPEATKWKKKKYILLLLFLFLIVFTGFFAVNKIAEVMIAMQLQQAGQDLLGRELNLDKLSYHMLSQELLLTGVRIENPPGYSNDIPAVSVGQIFVSVAPMDILFKRQIHIKKLHLEELEINPELKKIPLSIADVIQLIIAPEFNLMTLRGEMKKQGSSPKKKLKSGKPYFIRVDELLVDQVKVSFVNLRIKILPEALQIPHSFTLPKYEQRNLGQSGDMTINDLIKLVLQRHMDEAKTKFKETVDTWVEKLPDNFWGKKIRELLEKALQKQNENAGQENQKRNHN